MRLSLLVALQVAAVFGQDSGTVLSTMVHATTLRNTSKLPKEKLAEVDPLLAAGNRDRQAGEFNRATEEFGHAISLLEGKPWTAERAFTQSLTMKAKHYILQPQERLVLVFGQTFEVNRVTDKRPPLEISLVPAEGKGSPEFLKTVGQMNLAFRTVPFETSVTIPDVADGNYRILANFEGVGEKSIPVKVARGMMARMEADRARAAKVAKAPEVATALGHLARVEYANKGEEGERLSRADLAQELTQAEQMLGLFEKGKDPFLNRYGDLEKFYKSAVDGTYQPYRLYVPTDYNPSSSYPLLVLLHGMGGDQNTLFDSYGNGEVTKLAEHHSYLVVCPKGREPASMYRGAAEQDVLDVLADVRRAYKVNGKRLYLAGHSMGAYGTWSVAAHHPDEWAGLALFAGGGDPAIAPKLKAIPQFVVHGDADPTVPVTQSRTMVEALKKAGADVTFQEIPGGNHNSVVVPNFPAMFEFFDKHSLDTQKKAA